MVIWGHYSASSENIVSRISQGRDHRNFRVLFCHSGSFMGFLLPLRRLMLQYFEGRKTKLPWRISDADQCHPNLGCNISQARKPGRGKQGHSVAFLALAGPGNEQKDSVSLILDREACSYYLAKVSMCRNREGEREWEPGRRRKKSRGRGIRWKKGERRKGKGKER